MSSWDETLATIRKRPGMYIGDTRDGTGLHHMLWEVVANVVDEHLAGHCSKATIVIHADSSVSVTDDGRGISVAADAHGKRFAERLTTELHATPTKDGHYPHAHVGRLAGVGLAVVNALSDTFELDVWRDGARWTQRFAHGRPTGKFRRHGGARRTGTRVRFRPDPAIFGSSEYAYEPIAQQLTELATISKGLAFDLRDERRRRASLRSAGGLADFLDPDRATITPVLRLQTTGERCQIDVAAQWDVHHQYDDNAEIGFWIDSFVNMQRTPGGGTHVSGFKRGLFLAFDAMRRRRRIPRTQIRRSVVRGLRAAIHVRILGNPKFGGPTRDHLADEEIGTAVRDMVVRLFTDELVRSPTLFKKLVERTSLP